MENGAVTEGPAQSGGSWKEFLVTGLQSRHSAQNVSSGRSQAAFVLVAGSVSFSYSISM